jgi:hypothetical protein
MKNTGKMNTSLQTESKDLITESPDAKDVIQHGLNTISDIVTKVGPGEEWTGIVVAAQEDRAKLLCNTPGETAF